MIATDVHAATSGAAWELRAWTADTAPVLDGWRVYPASNSALYIPDHSIGGIGGTLLIDER